MRFSFWQQDLSPHSVPLIEALARRGHTVSLGTSGTLSAARVSIGWKSYVPQGVELISLSPDHVSDQVQEKAVHGSIHLLQGLPRRGILREVQATLCRTGVRWGSVMERINDRGWKGGLKHLDYWYRLNRPCAPQFILGIGAGAVECYQPKFGERPVVPFAYFLKSREVVSPSPWEDGQERKVEVLFVGQLVPRKRLDTLIQALDSPRLRGRFHLTCIGSGVDAVPLERMARRRLGETNVDFAGSLPMEEVADRMAKADLLVLPAEFDGWGAVVSEALMAGVPAVVSDQCGVRVAIREAGSGEVFPTGDVQALTEVLSRRIDAGPLRPEKRRSLSEWSQCLNAASGAAYLEKVARALETHSSLPPAPWEEP